MQSKMIYRGNFTGDINDTTIVPGIYHLGAADSYTHADITAAGMSVPVYCPFIQFENSEHTQLFLNLNIVYRKFSGNPPYWRTYESFADKSYSQPIS